MRKSWSSSPRLVVENSGGPSVSSRMSAEPPWVAAEVSSKVGLSATGSRARASNVPASRSEVRLPKKAGLVTPCRFRLRWPVRNSTLVAALAMAVRGGSFVRIHSAMGSSRRAISPADSP
jgi:hypothetical protein